MKTIIVLLFFVCAGYMNSLAGNVVGNGNKVDSIIQNFSVTDYNTHVLLKWGVTDNTTTDHFEIERMDVNGSFKTIALVLCDNEMADLQYSYKDKITLRDLFLFYRIKTINNKGEESFSTVTPVKLSSTGANLITVEYNNAQNNLKLHLPAEKGSYVCRFYNIMGQIVKTKTVSATSTNFTIGELNYGTYFMEIYHPQTGKRYYASFKKQSV